MGYIDMTGWKMYEHGIPDSRWKVLKEAGISNNGQKQWLCECSCENHTQKIIEGGELRRGKTKSCGCYRSELMKSTKKKDLTGQRYGELTIIEDSGQRANDGSIYWKCSCTCGNDNYLITSSELKRTGKRKKIHCNNSIHAIKDLTGQYFGKLEVIELDKTTLKSGGIKWKCKCHNCNREDLISVRSADLCFGKKSDLRLRSFIFKRSIKNKKYIGNK